MERFSGESLGKVNTCGQKGELSRGDEWIFFNDQRHKSQSHSERVAYFLTNFGRGERIRTSDLTVPNRALYQAEPRPDLPCVNCSPVKSCCACRMNPAACRI